MLAATGASEPPKAIRSYLARALQPGAELEAHYERWLDDSCLRLSQLTRPLLADVDRRLATGDRGQPLASSTAGRFRKVARSCIRRAVDLGMLDSDPWPPVPRGRSQRKAAMNRRPSIRSLPDPATMAKAIDLMVTHQPASRTYQVMTAVAYYGGLRPWEVVMLRPRALHLPEQGWGRSTSWRPTSPSTSPTSPRRAPDGCRSRRSSSGCL